MLVIHDGATAGGAVRIRPLRRAEFEYLVRGGAFDADEVELLHGALVELGAADPWHDEAVAEAAMQLRRQLGAAATVRVHQSLPLGEYSAPSPDITVATAVTHWSGLRARTLVVIEVAGATRDKDRGPKRQLYAGAAIDEYWLIDLEAGCIEVFAARDAALGVWGTATVYRRGEVARHGSVPALALGIDDLIALPWRRDLRPDAGAAKPDA